jgi:hypothetical protein
MYYDKATWAWLNGMYLAGAYDDPKNTTVAVDSDSAGSYLDTGDSELETKICGTPVRKLGW